MGRIVKYDKTKTDSSRVISPSSSSGGYPTNTGPIINENSANLWGNDFHGYEDLTGSMLINGDITIDWDEDDYDDSLYDEEEGDEIPTGSLYVKNKVEAKSVYGKSIFLDYPEIGDDTENKTNLLDLLKDHDSRINTNTIDIGKLKDAKIWGQGISANNYNITGNMSNVGDITFSGTSKTIGSISNTNLRPNGMYSNGNILVSDYNGNPWETTSKMKDILAMSYLSKSSLTLNSVIDYYTNGHYYNNPRVLWWVFNPTNLEREGHWWLGPTWANDYNKSDEGDHLNMSLYPSFDTTGMTNEDGNPTAEYFEKYNFTVGSKIKSFGFIKNGGKSNECLMADGSTKVISLDGLASSGDIPTKVSQLTNDVPYAEYDKNSPVILFSGIIHSNNNDGSMTYQPWVARPLMYAQHTGVKEIKLNYLEIDGNKKPTLVIEVVPKDGWSVKATSVHSTVSLDSHCNPLVDFGGNRRSQGYWTTGGVMPVDGNIYIQVWRTLDDNNDSTINDQIAYSAQEINLTIFGTSYKT